jgi:hypothetical protein
MFQSRQRANLQPKTLRHAGRSQLVRQQHLQRDHARRVQLLCAIHNTHPPSGDLFHHFVTRQTHSQASAHLRARESGRRRAPSTVIVARLIRLLQFFPGARRAQALKAFRAGGQRHSAGGTLS